MKQSPSSIARFRQRLRRGQLCLGAGVTFGDPLVSEALADSVDFLWIDLEHCGMSLDALNAHLLAGRAKGVPAIVRVAAGGAGLIKPVLDAGADGIVVPQVRSVEEVRQVVADCRYPPLGRRGFGPRVPSRYGRIAADSRFAARANREIFVGVMIETREAVEAMDEIAAVKGLDSVVIGPWDLSASLGRLGETEHPVVVAAMKRIIKTARAAGLFVGAGMGVDAAYAVRMARRGVQWIQLGGDFAYMIKALEETIRAARAT